MTDRSPARDRAHFTFREHLYFYTATAHVLTQPYVLPVPFRSVPFRPVPSPHFAPLALTMRSRRIAAFAFALAFACLHFCASATAIDEDDPVEPRAYDSCAPRDAPPDARCAYVRENALCARDDGLVPYLRVYYCAFARDELGAAIASAVVAFGTFATLATTAERFFVPALNAVAQALRLPSDVAGATLLSFGNGAPDIFAQIAALTHEEVKESSALAVGAVTGAGTFVTTFVFPCVVLSALHGMGENGVVKLNRESFARDALFYAVASACALGAFVDGSVEAWEAAGLFSLYLVYLVALLAPGRVRAVLRRARDGALGNDSVRDVGMAGAASDGEDALEPMMDDERATSDEIQETDSGDDASDTLTEENIDGVPWTRTMRQNVGWMMKRLQRALVAVLSLTMPELGRGARVTKWQARMLPITAPLFTLFATGLLPDHIRWIGVAYGLFASCLTAFIVALTWQDISDRASVRALLTACAFFQSIVWMNTAASELVSLLSAVGKVTGISEAFLGATVLAWGNSVGDFVSNTVVAREGNPNMAIAACFAGPMMNLLVGTSFGLMLHIFKYGPVTGYVMPNELVLLGGGLMFTLTYACLAIPLVHRWEIGRKTAICMITFYAAFSVVYALTCTHYIFKNPWLGPQKP